MYWLGKIVGAAIGYWLGGPFGAIAGAILGHFLYDVKQGRPQAFGSGAATRAEIERAFFRTTFLVMGHVAKADGRVSEAEIAAAEAVMVRMRLNPAQREQAKQYFREGKGDDFPLAATLEEFRRRCRWRQPLILLFLEIQLQVALADRHVNPAESRVLGKVFEHLGFSRHEFERLLAMMRGAQHYYVYAYAGGPRRPAAPSLADAYAVLGVPETASDAEIKKAYRRLMSQHHPDKLVARGLPKEMIELAKEKVQEINRAYDQLMKARSRAA